MYTFLFIPKKFIYSFSFSLSFYFPFLFFLLFSFPVFFFFPFLFLFLFLFLFVMLISKYACLSLYAYKNFYFCYSRSVSPSGPYHLLSRNGLQHPFAENCATTPALRVAIFLGIKLFTAYQLYYKYLMRKKKKGDYFL